MKLFEPMDPDFPESLGNPPVFIGLLVGIVLGVWQIWSTM